MPTVYLRRVGADQRRPILVSPQDPHKKSSRRVLLFVANSERASVAAKCPEALSTFTANDAQASVSELQSYYWRISAATSSPNFFWIYSWVSGSKSVMSNIRRTSTISLSFPGMREAHSSASSRDFTWMIQ